MPRISRECREKCEYVINFTKLLKTFAVFAAFGLICKFAS